MADDYILALDDTSRTENIGYKAKNLRFLAEKGFATPATHVCTWDAYMGYLQGDGEVLKVLREELATKLDESRHYAVRSSANLEDGRVASFAGQFTSMLNVHGVDEAVRAIKAIWTTARSPAIEAYLAQSGADKQDLKMAVIIQEMVPPQISGVAFSRNPITGLDEVIVEAVKGSGEALVQEGVTPARWINKWGTWTSAPEQPVNGYGIEQGLIEEVVRQTKEIARAYGRPVDLEWVYDGHRVNWVQLREITSLDIPIYSNRISREVFPGIIKPLVWSVNVPLVNGAWVDLLTELIGPNDIDAESLAGYFYSRAYFDMGALGRILELMGLPRETLELLIGIEVEGPERPSFRPSPGTLALLPRMLRFGLDKTRFARKVEAFLPAMEAEFRAVENGQRPAQSEQQLLQGIERLYQLAQKTAYYNIVTPLLMHAYNRILKGQLGRIGVDFESFDLTGGMQELEQFEPNVHLARLHQLYISLGDELQASIRSGGFGRLAELPAAAELKEGIIKFLEQFGHLSDSGNDFSHQPWRENPDLVVQMITSYAPLESRDATKVQFKDLKLTAVRRPVVKSVYNRARHFRWYREAVSSLYTYGYGLFRDHFLALGERFAERGILADSEDIFFLYMDEVRAAVEKGRLAQNCQTLVRERQDEVDRVRDVAPPEIIYGDQAPPLVPNPGKGLKGIPTSRGNYTGPARIVVGIQDMNKLQAGDVLVVPFSDVGWTPLFTKAGAVIAESGGILSHSSIIAREYGIPAVVSVPGACQLPDGTLVTVDGYRGEILVHEQTGIARVGQTDGAL